MQTPTREDFIALRFRIIQLEDEEDPELMAVCVALRSCLGHAEEWIMVYGSQHSEFGSGVVYAAKKLYQDTKEYLDKLPPHVYHTEKD